MTGRGLAYAAIYGAAVTVAAYLLAQGNVVAFTAALFALSLVATVIEWRRYRRGRGHLSDDTGTRDRR